MQCGVPLKNFTTFKIGGRARWFFISRKKEELLEAIKVAKELKIPFFILGGGSNVLFGDKGFDGLVIKCAMADMEIEGNKLMVESGAMLADVVKSSLTCSLSGMEWAAGIPGTIGGAIFGNAQAFGIRVSELVREVEAVDIKTLKVKKFSNSACQFSVKMSLFKKAKKFVILSAVLELEPKDKKEIREKIAEFLAYRAKGHPINYPSAGSMFINTEGKIKNKKLLEKFPQLVDLNKKGIIPSGFLIENCNLRGKQIGKAQISDKHGNFIINKGGAKAKDVLKLINLAKKKVKQKFKISLKEEVIIVK